MAFTIALLPGLDGTGILFEPLLEHLPSDVRPMVIPLPNDSPLDYAALAPIIRSKLPSDSDFILLGESFSGPLSLMLAASHPAGLRGLILCATFVRNPTYFPSWMQHLARPSLFVLAPLFLRAKALVSGYSNPRLQQLLASSHSHYTAEVLAHRVRCVLTVDATSELARCPVPVAYLRGSRDWVVPSRNYRRIARINPSVRECIIHAPHLVLQTQPKAAADAILTFAKTIGL